MAADGMPFMGVRIIQAQRTVKTYKFVLKNLKILQPCKKSSEPEARTGMLDPKSTI
jgi:hypothetical protein